MAPSKRAAALFLILCITCAACVRDTADPRAEAEALLQDGRWSEAAELWKQRLLENPGDAAAHFHLGRCYLNGPVFFPDAAQGEIQTALRLFVENGGRSPIAEYTDQYFELRCHLELAKVHLRKYQEYARYGMPGRVLEGVVKDLKREAAAAEKIAPGSEDVANLNDIANAF